MFEGDSFEISVYCNVSFRKPDKSLKETTRDGGAVLQALSFKQVLYVSSLFAKMRIVFDYCNLLFEEFADQKQVG